MMVETLVIMGGEGRCVTMLMIYMVGLFTDTILFTYYI